MPKTKSKKPLNTKRRLTLPKYQTLRMSKSIRQPKPKLSKAPRLFKHSLQLIWKNKRLFGAITLIYIVLSLVLVKGFASTNNLAELKNSLLSLYQGSNAQISSSFAVFSVLLGSGNTAPSAVASTYQSVLLVIFSLAIIWSLRQSLALKKGQKIRIRDSFYKSLGQLVPFLLVLIVIGLELLPLMLANFLYGTIFGGGLAVTPIEKGLWLIFFVLLVVLSIYMVASSIIALYIVTLPDTTPMQALRSARELVRFRRWMIIRKLLFLPFILIVLAGVIILPVIIVAPVLAEWLFFGLSLFGLVVVHSYIYHLYRELL